MITLISLVVLSQPRRLPAPPFRVEARPVIFGERIRSALGEAWRVLIG